MLLPGENLWMQIKIHNCANNFSIASADLYTMNNLIKLSGRNAGQRHHFEYKQRWQIVWNMVIITVQFNGDFSSGEQVNKIKGV